MWLSGFKLVLRAYATLTGLVLTINITCFAWAWLHFGVQGGYGTLQQGDCSDSKQLNLWLHLAINVLSTVVLLGSSSFLVAASAPSRSEILRAHRKGSSLSIGLFSFRNVAHISARKVLLCAILALTSIPLHLFYNSAIFPVLSGNDYFWAVVTTDFLSGASFNLTAAETNMNLEFENFGSGNVSYDGPTATDFIGNYTMMQKDATSWERLSNGDCLKAYSQKLVPDHRNVVLVSSHVNTSNSILAFDNSEVNNEGSSDPTNWICSHDPGAEDQICDTSSYIKDPQNWAPFGFPIQYCLSEQTTGSCSVQFSSVIAIIIIISNALKLAVELFILFRIDLDDGITSVGDAIGYFMEYDDPSTTNMCLQGRTDKIPPPHLRVPTMYVDNRPRWGTVISSSRWVLSSLFLGAMVLFVMILLGLGVSFVSAKGYSTSASGLWSIGFGNIDPEILVASDNFGSPVELSLIANLPQLVLAVILFLYTGILSAFFTADEYASFAHKAQNLRVASPAGQQNGTWLLAMPKLWGLLFLVMQILLHWFVSQSLFVVDVAVYSEGGYYDDNFASISNCGFSPLAIICSLATMGVMLLLLLGLSLRRFPALGPPVMGNSSVAISAACHSQMRGEDTPYRKLRWGSVWAWSNGVEHCSFADVDEDSPSRMQILPLSPGKYYM